MTSPDATEPFSHPEQLKLLQRGMVVNDKPKALRCLQHTNYFRLSQVLAGFPQRGPAVPCRDVF